MKKTKDKEEKPYKVLSSEELRKINGGRWVTCVLQNGTKVKMWVD